MHDLDTIIHVKRDGLYDFMINCNFLYVILGSTRTLGYLLDLIHMASLFLNFMHDPYCDFLILSYVIYSHDHIEIILVYNFHTLFKVAFYHNLPCSINELFEKLQEYLIITCIYLKTVNIISHNHMNLYIHNAYFLIVLVSKCVVNHPCYEKLFNCKCNNFMMKYDAPSVTLYVVITHIPLHAAVFILALIVFLATSLHVACS